MTKPRLRQYCAMLLQPFVSYNLPDGRYLNTVPILTANWKAKKAGDIWTVPEGGGFGKFVRLGRMLLLSDDRCVEAKGQANVNVRSTKFVNKCLKEKSGYVES